MDEEIGATCVNPNITDGPLEGDRVITENAQTQPDLATLIKADLLIFVRGFLVSMLSYCIARCYIGMFADDTADQEFTDYYPQDNMRALVDCQTQTKLIDGGSALVGSIFGSACVAISWHYYHRSKLTKDRITAEISERLLEDGARIIKLVIEKEANEAQKSMDVTSKVQFAHKENNSNYSQYVGSLYSKVSTLLGNGDNHHQEEKKDYSPNSQYYQSGVPNDSCGCCCCTCTQHPDQHTPQLVGTNGIHPQLVGIDAAHPQLTGVDETKDVDDI